MKRFLEKHIIVAIFILFFLCINVSFSFADPIDEDPNLSASRIPLLSRISTLNDCGYNEVYDMQLKDTVLYAGGRGGCASGGSPVYDVSDTRRPIKLYEIDTNSRHFGIEIRDSIYYAASEEELNVYDISGKYLSSFPIIGYAYDIELVDDIAYCVSNRTIGHVASLVGFITTIDISDPYYLSEIGSQMVIDYPFGAHPPNLTNVIVENGFAYIGKEGLRTFDVSNPKNIIFSGTNDVSKRNGYPAHRQDDMQISGDRRVFKAHQQFGILVYFADDGNPSKPFLNHIIGPETITIGGNIAFEVVENTMFVVTAADRSFKVLDISNVNYPVLLKSAIVSGQQYNSTVEIELDIDRGLAFISTKGYISVYDIREFLP